MTSYVLTLIGKAEETVQPAQFEAMGCAGRGGWCQRY